MAINFPNSPTIDDTYTLDTTTWKWDGVSWNVIAATADTGTISIPTDISDLSDNQELIPNDVSELTDTTNIIPTSLLDLNITDGTSGQVLTTNGDGIFAFASVSGGSEGGALQNLFATINADNGTTTADNTIDSLTISGGTGITTSIIGDTVSISYSGPEVNSSGDLTDFQNASLTIDKIYEPAYVMLRVDNVGTSSYTFAPHYSGNNPTIYLISGMTVAFDLDAIPGHPFEIQDSLGDPYNEGLVHVSSSGIVSTGANAQGKDSGTLYWRIPETTASPPNFRYQCQVHASMVGPITIKDLSAL